MNHDNDFPENKDEAIGRAKEAAGAISGNDELKNEGRVDQAVGGAKAAVDTIANSIKDGVDKVLDTVSGEDKGEKS